MDLAKKAIKIVKARTYNKKSSYWNNKATQAIMPAVALAAKAAAKTFTKKKKKVKMEYVAKGEGIETRFDLSYPPSSAVKVMKNSIHPIM